MTTTCLFSLRSELLSSLGIVDCHVIHAPTDHPEITYNVKLFEMLKKARDELVQVIQQQLESEMNDSAFQGLVYCRSKDGVEELAALIGCKPFHADRSITEQTASFKDWVGGKQKSIVCSSLLGCGVDVESVAVIVHFGTPWLILDFVQESGRPGQSGNSSISIIFA